ncbi:MAG TPA: TlpA disulfide reductase family protein [Bryobacteraceae bacterium]|nr:TlpA disulfide reductase family protein [Bryobacteraceae bacterium]
MTDRQKIIRKLIQYGLFVGVVLWIAFAFRGWNDETGHIQPVAQRKPLSDLVMPELNGASWRLSDHRGEVVLINYWASWCGPCRQETPGLESLARDYRYKGLAMVGVSLDKGSKAPVQSFVKEFHMTYPVVFPAPAQPFASDVEAIPTTVLVDRQGRVAKTYVGAVRESVFQADVESLLAERLDPAPAASRN